MIRDDFFLRYLLFFHYSAQLIEMLFISFSKQSQQRITRSQPFTEDAKSKQTLYFLEDNMIQQAEQAVISKTVCYWTYHCIPPTTTGNISISNVFFNEYFLVDACKKKLRDQQVRGLFMWARCLLLLSENIYIFSLMNVNNCWSDLTWTCLVWYHATFSLKIS